MTRLAASSAEMWAAISADNGDLVREVLLALEDRLADFRTALERGDLDALHRFFSEAAAWTREPPTEA